VCVRLGSGVGMVREGRWKSVWMGVEWCRVYVGERMWLG